ncbi:MAG: hypothetical protein HW390_1420 [Candidatus Brocadiaceae bacterium]|nr:hypothetical protein [Candidatus Brocadiaceae bacterium]
MAKPERCDNLKDFDEIIQNLTVQGDDCKLLLDSTSAFKELLSAGSNEEVLIERLKERGTIIDKLALVQEYCVSVKGYIDSIKNGAQKERIIGLLKQIQKQLDSTLSLNTEITTRLNQCISEININLRKIRESKTLMNTLRDPDARLAVHLDVSG